MHVFCSLKTHKIYKNETSKTWTLALARNIFLQFNILSSSSEVKWREKERELFVWLMKYFSTKIGPIKFEIRLFCCCCFCRSTSNGNWNWKTKKQTNKGAETDTKSRRGGKQITECLKKNLKRTHAKFPLFFPPNFPISILLQFQSFHFVLIFIDFNRASTQQHSFSFSSSALTLTHHSHSQFADERAAVNYLSFYFCHFVLFCFWQNSTFVWKQTCLEIFLV